MRGVSSAFKHLKRGPWDLLRTSRTVRYLGLVSLVLVVLTAALPTWRLLPGIRAEQFISLHYNVYFGVDRYGPWYHIYVPAVVGLVVFLVNFILQIVYARREPVLTLLFSVATVLIEVVLLIAMVFMVLLNLPNV